MKEPEFIAHRINTLAELQKLPTEYGVEIDLRDRKERLILQHDPFVDGEDFEPYLAEYKHGTMILNIKSERIEYRILDLLKKYKISNYFFLDSSFPMIMSLIREGEKKIAIRYSEYEKLDTVFSLQGKIDWVWVDCFTQLPIDKNVFISLKKAQFNLCLVSPELQGRSDDIVKYKNYLKDQGIVFDAICTKEYNIPTWS